MVSQNPVLIGKTPNSNLNIIVSAQILSPLAIINLQNLLFFYPISVRLDSDIGQDWDPVTWINSMITRSKLVEQLRDYQIRSQHKWPALTVFSPKPILSTRTDVAVSIFWALLFIVLLVSSYSTLYLKYYWISFIIMCLCILIPIRLRILRQSLARKRDRRLLLPLSM